MPSGLPIPVKLPFHRGHVDDVFIALRRAHHQSLEPRVDDERSYGIDQLHLQHFNRRHLRQQQPPRVSSPQIDLLQILIQTTLREQMFLPQQIFRLQSAPARVRPLGLIPP